ncbi:MAG: phage terminase large subunit family protein [Deltaproteobacteria bacterium]|nr:phage terminase large subunit family protein [Deltaproteobacteria bacterium]
MWKYLQPIYAAVPRDLTEFDWVIKKSAQGGASIFAMLFALHLALKGRVQIAYFLPTARKASEFSANRFIRLARENPPIHALFGDPDTPHSRRVVDEGSISMRRILHSILYFTSLEGKVSTESSPLDALVLDEVQEMLLTTIEKAQERLSASPLKAQLMVSTANFVGADIDYFYERSDQRAFFTRCRCAEGVNLAEQWDPRLGPLCIDRGNGTTPGVPTEHFFFCPRCGAVIADPQDGAFRARNPGARRVGWHFAQMLSPRQSARSIWDKWDNRVDTRNFYNRILGLAYTDPDTQPVSEAALRAAQNSDLRWGATPACRRRRGLHGDRSDGPRQPRCREGAHEKREAAPSPPRDHSGRESLAARGRPHARVPREVLRRGGTPEFQPGPRVRPRVRRPRFRRELPGPCGRDPHMGRPSDGQDDRPPQHGRVQSALHRLRRPIQNDVPRAPTLGGGGGRNARRAYAQPPDSDRYGNPNGHDLSGDLLAASPARGTRDRVPRGS